MKVSIEVEKGDLKFSSAFIKMSEEIVKRIDGVVELIGLDKLRVSSGQIREIQRTEAIIRKYKKKL